MRLLRRGGIGRIGVVADDTPSIRPVNFAFDGERVVIRTGDSVLAEAADRGTTAQLEVDEIDAFDHTGWSVIVTGLLTEHHGEVSPTNAPVQPWAPGDQTAARRPDAGIDHRPAAWPRAGRARWPVARGWQRLSGSVPTRRDAPPVVWSTRCIGGGSGCRGRGCSGSPAVAACSSWPTTPVSSPSMRCC